jgi:hypothetical protein
MNKHKLEIIGILGVVLLLIGTALAIEGNLPGGTSISVDITAPSDGAVKVYPPGTVELEGTASVGEGLPVANTALIYVIDASGSTASPSGGDCGPDQNPTDPPSVEDEIIDCEIAAGINLNEQAVTIGTVGEIAITIFAGAPVTADATPAGGDVPIIQPDADANLNTVMDAEEVMRSIWVAENPSAWGGFREFSIKPIPDIYNTDFAAAAQMACDNAASTTMTNKMVVFMSDGMANTGAHITTVLPCGDVVFHTFAIGSGSSCSGDPNGLGSLQEIADLTGGTCTEVPDPAQLPDILPAVITAKLLSLERNVDGGAFEVIPNSDIVPDLPAEGPVSATFGPLGLSLAPGIHELCVRATGSDAGGVGSVKECIKVTIATIDLTPETKVNELPAPDHTVTAKVEAGSDGGVPGVEVNFEVLSGPNDGESGSGTTDSNGEATFTYAATQCPTGLGTDTIEACFSDEQGYEVCDTATKDWVDTTPPEITCPADVTVEQETADGTVVALTATAIDACDADPTITNDTLAIYPLGTTTVTFTATDFSGNSASCSMTVTVVDTTAPDITVTVSPDTLWPPNHKMVNIVATVTVDDICDADPTVVLTSITSDEPDNDIGIGDGNTTNDIQAGIGTEDYEFQLRAERAGTGDGRVYTITYTATDASGNEASADATVVVPHDMD